MANIKLKNKSGEEVSYANISTVSIPNSNGSGSVVFVDTSDGTADAGDILALKTAYVNGTAVTGTMVNNGEIETTLTVQGSKYIIPEGYTSGGMVAAQLTASTITSDSLNISTYEASSGDYDAKANITIPAGYYNETTLEKTLTDIFPAPESEGTVDKLLAGYTLYDHSGKVVAGTMTNNGAAGSTISTQGGTYTIPEGYHNGEGVVTANLAAGSATTPTTTKQQSQPSISVSSTGLITASVAETSVDVTPTVSAGYISAGTAGTITMSANSNTSQLTVQAAKTVTPTTSSQTAVAAGVYTTGVITVGAISTQTKTATANGTVTPDSGKYLSSVTVSLPTYSNLA